MARVAELVLIALVCVIVGAALVAPGPSLEQRAGVLTAAGTVLLVISRRRPR